MTAAKSCLNVSRCSIDRNRLHIVVTPEPEVVTPHITLVSYTTCLRNSSSIPTTPVVQLEEIKSVDNVTIGVSIDTWFCSNINQVDWTLPRCQEDTILNKLSYTTSVLSYNTYPRAELLLDISIRRLITNRIQYSLCCCILIQCNLTGSRIQCSNERITITLYCIEINILESTICVVNSTTLKSFLQLSLAEYVRVASDILAEQLVPLGISSTALWSDCITTNYNRLRNEVILVRTY